MERTTRLVHLLTAITLTLLTPRPRDQRGLSQSTENAILLAGAIVR
ncbi:hypothetical protein [Enemella dayhoffiae]|nr:hypothetical protein [Enemella dayhoffiae]